MKKRFNPNVSFDEEVTPNRDLDIDFSFSMSYSYIV